MMDFSMEPGTFLFELWQARFSLLRGASTTMASAGLTILVSTLCGALVGVILTYAWWPLRLVVILIGDLAEDEAEHGLGSSGGRDVDDRRRAHAAARRGNSLN